MRTHRLILVSLVAPCMALLILTGCRKTFVDDPDARFTFSCDTVYFDTTVTGTGTKTEQLVIRNPYKKSIIIDNIVMEQGSSSEYILNINGQGSHHAGTIEIKGHDSMYVFVQAKLRKNNHDTIGIHLDKIQVYHHGIKQEIYAASWGRDVSAVQSRIVSSTTWPAGKSYIISDSLVIGENQTLTIEEGVNVYFKPKANVIVRGCLVVKGTVKRPVFFGSFRLEYYYLQIPGKWGSIVFEPSSTGCTISNARIMSGTNALYVKPRTHATKAELTLENVYVESMSSAGLMCSNAKVSAVNCVFADCDRFAVSITGGGIYSFIHTTISNYNNFAVRHGESVRVSNMVTPNETPQALKFSMINSIVVGHAMNELLFEKQSGTAFDAQVSSSLVRAKNKDEYYDESSFLLGDKDIVFINKSKDFELDSVSVARHKANSTVSHAYPGDLNGHNRLEDGKPDLGAYEYYKKPKKK